MPDHNADDWTFSTLKIYFDQVIADREAIGVTRHSYEHAAMVIAVEAQKSLVLQAQQSAAEAVRKAETAMEKRFDSVNEFRAQLSDQARTFLPRPEFDVQHLAMSSRIAALEKSINDIQGRRSGVTEGWGWAVAAVLFVITLLGAALTLSGAFK